MFPFDLIAGIVRPFRATEQPIEDSDDEMVGALRMPVSVHMTSLTHHSNKGRISISGRYRLRCRYTGQLGGRRQHVYVDRHSCA